MGIEGFKWLGGDVTGGVTGGMRRRVAIVTWLIVMATLAPCTKAAEEPLTLGIFPRNRAAETMAMYSPLAQHLSERLGRKVILVTARDFESFWKEVTEQRYDIVHYNPYHYVQSAQAYKVIAYNQEFGKNAIAGALFVRKDSGITSIAQLRGRTIMFGGGRDAMLSYIAPRFLLMQAGLKEGDFVTKFAVNPPNALLALNNGQADAAGGGEILIDLPAVRNAIDVQGLTVLGKTEPLLFLPWAVKRAMPPKLAGAVQSTLLGLGNSEAGKNVLHAAKTTSIGKADDKDYDPHRKMTAAVFGPKGAAK